MSLYQAEQHERLTYGEAPVNAEAGTAQPDSATLGNCTHKGVAGVSTEEMALLLRTSETPLEICRPSYEGL